VTLPHQHSVAQIQEDWTHATAQAFESGRQPLLELGMDRRLLYNLPLLFALEQWCHTRSDMSEPLMITGGVDALWPVPLLYPTAQFPVNRGTYSPVADLEEREYPSVVKEPERSNQENPIRNATDNASPMPLPFVYSGADEATHLASLTTQSMQRLQSGLIYTVDLPAAMQPIMYAHSQPHVNATWSTFPLALLHATALDATMPHATLPHAVASPPTDDQWLAWAALIMIVLLVLFALLI